MTALPPVTHPHRASRSTPRRRHTPFPTPALFSLLACVALALHSSAAPGPLPLSDIASIHQLPAGTNRTGRPFSLQATVTYFNDTWPICFLQDDTAATFVHMDYRQWSLRVGDRVQAEGHLHEDGLPIVLHYTTLATNSPLPNPKVAPLSELARGLNDSHRVKATGWLTRAWDQNGHQILEMVGEFGQRFRAAIPAAATSPDLIQSWLGGRLDLVGVCGLEFSPAHEHIGFRLWVPSTNAILAQPLGEPSPDPSETRPIASIALQNFDRDHPRPFQITGIVTLQKSDQAFYLQDASGGVRVESVNPRHLQPGIYVTALGVAAEGAFAPYLSHARTRIEYGVPPGTIEATPCTASELLSGTHEGQLVSVEGRIISTYSEAGRHAWLLEADNTIFSASLHTPTPNRAPALLPGSTVRVTGVCEVKVDQTRTPRTFQIQAARADAFLVTHALPWWTLGRLLAAAAAAAGSAVLAVAWGATLRRRVARQTRRIGEQLDLLRASEQRHRSVTESVNEGLFITDLQHDIVDVNPRLLVMTGYAREQLLGQPAHDALFPPSDRLRVRQQFERLARGEGGEFEPTILRSDGTEFHALFVGSPLRDGHAKVIGIVGAILDITGRKQSETELKQSLSEKETLLREVHHRVKNNLQVISSLLYFQQRKTQTPEVAANLQESRDRIAAIALVHEQLYESHDLGHIDFAAYLRNLATQIIRGSGRAEGLVHLELTGSSFTLDVARAVPCALILNELITNTLKHAFPNGQPGSIRIHLASTHSPPHSGQLTIADDGIGLPPGAESGSPDSLGLRLVHRLVDQLQGSFERLQVPQGTAFLISFPLSS